MKISCYFALAIFATFASLANGQMYELVGNGYCASSTTGEYDIAQRGGIYSVEECDKLCRRTNNYSEGLRGFDFSYGPSYTCFCLYDNGTSPGSSSAEPRCPESSEFIDCDDAWPGTGVIDTTLDWNGHTCYRYKESVGFPVPPVPLPDGVEYVGLGNCLAPSGNFEYDWTGSNDSSHTLESCDQHCQEYPQGLRGFSLDARRCTCYYDDDYVPGGPLASQPCPADRQCYHTSNDGYGEIESSNREAALINPDGPRCWKYTSFPVVEATGDPHQMYELVGDGLNDFCSSAAGAHAIAFRYYVDTLEECDKVCRRSNNYSPGLRGFTYYTGPAAKQCRCMYDAGTGPGNDLGDPYCPAGSEFRYCYDYGYTGTGVIDTTQDVDGWQCYRYTDFPVPSVSIPNHLEFVGTGHCQPNVGHSHDFTVSRPAPFNLETCDQHCQEYPQHLRGFTYDHDDCWCFYDNDYVPGGPLASQPCPADRTCTHYQNGEGEIESSTNSLALSCWKYTTSTEATGDPHFRTWKDEHFEFHGQCDIVMTHVENFKKGIDLAIHLRTKIVRYWSYIQTVAIRLGNDILEVQGSGAKEDGEEKRHYRMNYEYRGPLETLGGFPVTISPRNNKYTIDLDSIYPGQKIEIKTFKEFVGVKIIGATQESFGNAVGITGDFKTGKTLARDGVTVLDDFNDLGLEWQVLPSDGKLFHEMARPQFPELCYLPEDPRGARTRRLGVSEITEEAAEAACAGLNDEFDRKGCVYDILATQDMEMVGAY